MAWPESEITKLEALRAGGFEKGKAQQMDEFH